MSVYINQGDTNLSELRNNFSQQQTDNEKILLQRDKCVFLHQALSSPVLRTLSSAEGAYLYDNAGNKLLDLHGNGVHNAGFNNPKVAEAIIHQLQSKLSFSPRRYTNQIAVELAEKLVKISPDGLGRVLFCPGGSQAIEMAIMLAKQVSGKWKTLSYWDAYHGNGFQAMSVGGQNHFSTGNGPMLSGSLHAEFPNYYRNPWGWKDTRKIDDEYLRQLQLIIEHNPEIAALVAEPVSANPSVPTVYYWKGVRDLCDRHGILLIFDEIITGFGRTGKMFACEHFVTPDILVIGKSLGGGILPFAGIIAHEKFNVLQQKSIGHFTHEKNPLCAAAGLAEIAFIEENMLVENSKMLGQYLIRELTKLKETCALVGHIEGIGLHIGVELVRDKASKEKAIEEAEALMYACLEKGISLKIIDQNIVTIRPSLIIGKSEADFIVQTLCTVLKGLTEKAPQ